MTVLYCTLRMHRVSVAIQRMSSSAVVDVVVVGVGVVVVAVVMQIII